MKLLQYIGPFAAGDMIEIPARQGYKYVHIGFQVPKRQPIAYTTAKLAADIEINNDMRYRINDNDLLEFDDLAETKWRIRFLDNLPWGSIIDIVYTIDKI